jgi:hypothetical protein
MSIRSVQFLHCWTDTQKRLCSIFHLKRSRTVNVIGKSLQDAPTLADSYSLPFTQRYIEVDSEARHNIVNVI